jgi:hypothetical protein
MPSHVPNLACRQSRKRRQQVMPEPATESFRQHPLWNVTSKFEQNTSGQARSDTRARLPCGFGIEAGRSGRINSIVRRE